MALNLMLNDSRNHIKLESRLAVKSQTRLAWLFGCCHAQGLSLGLLFCPSELLDSNIQHLLEGGKDWFCWVLVLRKLQLHLCLLESVLGVESSQVLGLCGLEWRL